jgi:hypothetical protein
MKYQMAFAAVIGAAATAGGQASHADHGALARPASVSSANGVIVRRDGIRTVTVTASDYSFAAPDTIPQGSRSCLLNGGRGCITRCSSDWTPERRWLTCSPP